VKVIIAGGRDYTLSNQDIERLESIREKVTEVVSGGAKGADSDGEVWAELEGIPVRRFTAEWSKHGRGAGVVRNRGMVEYANAAVVFSGGRGTRTLFELAGKANLVIYDWRV